MFGHDRKSKQDKLDESDSAPQGTPVPGEPESLRSMLSASAEIAGLFHSGPLAEIIHEAQTDPVGFRARMIAQAQAAGGGAGFIMTPQGMTPIGAPTPPTPLAPTTPTTPPAPPAAEHPPDILDQLTQLADLKDKGVLTDAEFQQAKHKLLGG
jgi:hypothetical protein